VLHVVDCSMSCGACSSDWHSHGIPQTQVHLQNHGVTVKCAMPCHTTSNIHDALHYRLQMACSQQIEASAGGNWQLSISSSRNRRRTACLVCSAAS
jgi:hypothetical protein